MTITLTQCPRCGACPAETRCECGYDPAVMTAEGRSRAVLEHVEAIRALIYQGPPVFSCVWCGNETATRHGLREHALVCPENPVTIRLAARERDIERAIKVAVSTLYFADNSDYQTALWRVVAALNPEAADLLENDEVAAYAKYCEVLEKPEVTSGD